MYKGTQTTTHCQQTNSKQDCLKIKSPQKKGLIQKKKMKEFWTSYYIIMSK